MDLDDLLKEYWPAIVGVVVVLLTAIVLWPSEEDAQADPSLELVAISPLTADAQRVLAEKQAKETQPKGDPQPTSSPKEPPRTPPEYQILEMVEAFPLDQSRVENREFKTGDPEVERALGDVEITLYQEQECSSCVKMRSFLEKNGVSVISRNVEEDSNQRERARRLSGTRALPVLVVDGKVVPGLSEEEVQAALTWAVKNRVEAEAQAKPRL